MSTALRIAILLVFACAQPAFAADKSGIAVVMAQTAAKAFQAGDYERAAEMYMNAFRAADEADYLFGAARSYHVAGHDERAAELYRKYLDREVVDPERAKKANEYLDAIGEKRALGLLQDAETAARGDDFKLALSLYLNAYKLAPAHVEWLLKAGVAAEKAGLLADARTNLEKYLEKAPADAVDRVQAEARLEAIRRKLVPDEVKSPVLVTKPIQQEAHLPPVEVRQPMQPEPQREWLPWLLTGGGAGAALAGVGVLIWGAADLAQYNKDVAKGPDGAVRTMTFADAQTRASSINLRLGVGGALAGVGLASAGVGTWLLLRAPDKTQTRLEVGVGHLFLTTRF